MMTEQEAAPIRPPEPITITIVRARNLVGLIYKFMIVFVLMILSVNIVPLHSMVNNIALSFLFSISNDMVLKCFSTAIQIHFPLILNVIHNQKSF